MIRKTKAQIFSQLMHFVPYLPNSSRSPTFENQELLAKLFFNQVTGLNYEEFISAYYAYPNVLAEFQANCLIDNRLEISVTEPVLLSKFWRDANGEISRGSVKVRIAIVVTAVKERACKNRSMVVELELATHEETEHCSGMEYPTVHLNVQRCDSATRNNGAALTTDAFIGKPAQHYARTLRTAIYYLVRDYAHTERPEIYNGEQRN